MSTGVLEMGKDKPMPTKPQYSTFRIHASDGEDLSELADRLNLSVADCFRELGFAEVVRQRLLTLAEQRLRELKARRPQ